MSNEPTGAATTQVGGENLSNEERGPIELQPLRPTSAPHANNAPELVALVNLPENERLRRELENSRESQQRLNAVLTATQQSKDDVDKSLKKSQRTRKKLIWMIGLIFPALVVISLTLGILFKKKGHSNPTSSTPPAANLTVSTSQYADVPPIADSKISAAFINAENIITSPASSDPTIEVVYIGDHGKICIRVKSGTMWHNNIRCVEGTNAMPNSPITILDWLGGPSIYYFTANHFVAGIDYIPNTDSWKFSSVNSQKFLAHNQSQIASLAWSNATQTWLYFQDPSQQIREFGLDDYRDTSWREGAAGALSKAMVGCGIAVMRWLNGTDQVEEIIFQSGNGGLAGRMYRESIWQPDIYAIDGTMDIVPNGAVIAGTTITDSTGNSTILITYGATSGFLSVQARATKGTPDSALGAFSARVEIVEGDGQPQVGTAAVGSLGVPSLYFMSKDEMFELQAGSAFAVNWTKTTL